MSQPPVPLTPNNAPQSAAAPALESGFITPEGHRIVLQSLTDLPAPEALPPRPRRPKARRSRPVPEASAAAPSAAPDAAAPAAAAPQYGAAASADAPAPASARKPEASATPPDDVPVTEGADVPAADSADAPALPAPEGGAAVSLKAQNILQQLIAAVQSQEAQAESAAVLASADPASANPEFVAPKQAAAPFTGAPLEVAPLEGAAVGAAALGARTAAPLAAPAPNEEGPELSAAELERYNRMLLKAGDPCPACGQGSLVLRQSGKVAFLGCSCFPRCKLRYFTRTLSPVHTLKLLTSLCPQCQAPLAVKKGRYGLFIGCSNYPNCTYSPKEAAPESAIACPICHQGVLRQRRSSSGKSFYACDSYPKCDFKMMDAPYVKTCPECGFSLRFKKKVKAGIALVCANPKCPSRKRRKYDLLSAQA